MTAVVLAITVGAQAILPSFAPVNAGERHHDPAAQFIAPSRGTRLGALFENMIATQVVMDAGGQIGQRRTDQIALGRMQVAARWVAAQCPTRIRVLFPSRQAQRKLEQDRQRVAVEGVGNGPLAPAHCGERYRQRIGLQRQFDARRSSIAAKWIGLVGPVQSTRTWCVAVQVVLAGLVVGDDSRKGI